MLLRVRRAVAASELEEAAIDVLHLAIGGVARDEAASHGVGERRLLRGEHCAVDERVVRGVAGGRAQLRLGLDDRALERGAPLGACVTRVTNTTPNTMVMRRGLSGTELGSANTAAIDSAPLMLPNTITCCQRMGTTSRRIARSTRKQPYTEMARPACSATSASRMEPASA